MVKGCTQPRMWLQRSQGGAKFPTGGNGSQSLARERSPWLLPGEVEQTRCDSGADGIVRIKRERDSLHGRLVRVREIPIDRHCPVFDQNRSSSMLFSNTFNVKPEGICSPA